MSTPRIVRAAIIGCGSYGAEHARFLSAFPGVSLHAVADIAAPRAEEFKQRYGASYATGDGHRLFSYVPPTDCGCQMLGGDDQAGG